MTMGDLIDIEEAKQKRDFELMAKFSAKLPANDQVDLSELYQDFLADPRPPKWFLIVPIIMISGSITGLVGFLKFLEWLSRYYK